MYCSVNGRKNMLSGHLVNFYGIKEFNRPQIKGGNFERF